MAGFVERWWSSILVGCVATPPARLPVYPLQGVPGSTSCTAPQRLSHHHVGMGRPAVDISLSGFLKKAQDSISSHGGVALIMSERQPIRGKRIWLGFGVVQSDVDTGGHRYCSHVYGALEIRGIHGSGMGPYLPRVRRKCPPIMGLYPLRTALWSSNQSAISQRD